MPWGKVDDAATDHPKAQHVGSIGIALFWRSICYSNRWLTDGFVPKAVVDKWAAIDGRAGTAAVNLMFDAPPGFMHGLWEKAEGGIRVHDFLEYNPSKAQVMSDRTAAKARVARARFLRSSPDVRPNSGRTSPEVPEKFEVGSLYPGPVPSPSVPDQSPPPSPSPPDPARSAGPPSVGAGTHAKGPNGGPPADAGPPLWDEIALKIKGEIDAKEFRTWFDPTRQIAFDEGANMLTVGVPSAVFRDWISSRHGELLARLAESFRAGLRLNFVVAVAR